MVACVTCNKVGDRPAECVRPEVRQQLMYVISDATIAKGGFLLPLCTMNGAEVDTGGAKAAGCLRPEARGVLVLGLICA